MTTRRWKMLGAAVLVGSAYLLARAGAETPLPTVEHVDLQRYQGRWYEIARLPLFWERKCAAEITATYTLRPDGTVDVLNQCRKADGSSMQSHGEAKVVSRDGSNARLKVTFFKPFSGDYWILNLDPEYRCALVGTPNRKNLWLLSRTPQLDAGVQDRVLGRARELGFDTRGLIFTRP